MSETEPNVWRLAAGTPAAGWWRPRRVGAGPAWYRRCQALAEQPGMTLTVLGLLILALAIQLNGLATLSLGPPQEPNYYWSRPWYADLSLWLQRLPVWLCQAPVRQGLTVLGAGLIVGGLPWAWWGSSRALASRDGVAGTGAGWPVISMMLVFCFLPFLAVMVYRPVMSMILNSLGV